MALSNASWTIGNAFGTGAGMNGYHQGLYSLDPLGGGSDEVWDHSHLSSAEVTKRIKKAALLFGASLVGITQMKEEWVYSKYSGMDNEAGINKQGDILITEVEKVELPEGQIARKEAQGLIVDEFQNLELADAKDTFIAAMESVDPSLLPPSAPPPAAMKAFPAGMLMGELPSILNEVPVEMLYYFAESFGLEFEIAAIDPSLSAKARYMEDGTLSIPETYNTCIVLAYEMDYEGYKTSPASPSGAATGNGYSRMAFTGACLAEFIRNLGYGAVPCGNNTALSVPLAIDAGLGEKSRMGCLVTPKYGPRVRLNKIFTNMPLDYDTPISFGVEQFCQVCKKCVDNCPSSALRDSEQSYTSAGLCPFGTFQGE